jgi:hypothetical protein
MIISRCYFSEIHQIINKFDKRTKKSKYLRYNSKLEAGRVRRKEALQNTASGGNLDRRKSSFAVLDFENFGNVTDADRGRLSEREEEKEGCEEDERNGGNWRGVHREQWR